MLQPYLPSHAPSLAAVSAGAQRITGSRDAAHAQPLPPSARPGLALVGDAGYHRDAVTGHGISDAFRDAELLAGAIDTSLRCPPLERSALAAYEQERDRLAARIFELTVDLQPSRARELPRAAARPRRGHRRAGRTALLAPAAAGGTRAPVRSTQDDRRTLHRARPTATGRRQPPQRKHSMSTDTTPGTLRRNGVDTRNPLRHAGRGARDARSPRSSSSGPRTSGSPEPTAGRPSTTSSAPGRSGRMNASSCSTQTTPQSSSGGTTAPPRRVPAARLAACITAGIANIAAARKVTLTEVRSTVPVTSTSTGSSGSRTSATATSR